MEFLHKLLLNILPTIHQTILDVQSYSFVRFVFALAHSILLKYCCDLLNPWPMHFVIVRLLHRDGLFVMYPICILEFSVKNTCSQIILNGKVSASYLRLYKILQFPVYRLLILLSDFLVWLTALWSHQNGCCYHSPMNRTNNKFNKNQIRRSLISLGQLQY